VSGFRIWTMALPINGPRAIPATEVKPNSDIGMLRALSPFQTSLMEPPTMLIATDEPPPPKNLVTTSVAKLSAKADPNRESSKTMYAIFVWVRNLKFNMRLETHKVAWHAARVFCQGYEDKWE